MSFATGGAFLPSLIPAAKKQALSTNYLKFNDGTVAGDTDTFAQQYLPELYEAEVERYGNRTLSGFLRMVGAEMPMTSDQVIWSEQNRLHVSYDQVVIADESQNYTFKELTTLITRIGKNTKLLICGDPMQSDINGKTGFKF